jgi:Holliday junction DNA helicase RuvA
LIGRLLGRIVDEDGGGGLCVDVGGVGYDVTVPLGTGGRLAPDAAGLVTIFVHTHVREDALELFGFATPNERAAFRTLIGIANVGPKLALSILGSVSVHDLAALVARGDVTRLTTIPGVGKKTAERLALELKGKLDPGAAVRAPAAATPAGPAGTKADLLVGALTRMGFRPAEADRALAALSQGRDLEQTPLGDLVREALAVLSR